MMEGMLDVLCWLGLLVGMTLGLLGLVTPERALRFVGLRVGAPEGQAEVRATYGGFFLSLEVGAAVLWQVAGTPQAVLVVGLAWLGAALGRVASLVVDGKRTPKNIGGVVFEAGLGLLHLTVLFSG
jgi:hypothetical protein